MKKGEGKMAKAAVTTDRAKSRPKRTPLGQRDRLSFRGITIPKGMIPRVINDHDNRIEDALQAGYQFVMSNGKLGDARCADPSKMGSYVTKSVGGGTTGFLMAIPEDFYKEDQAAKQRQVEEMERAMKAPPRKLSYEGEKGDGEVYGPGLTEE